MGNDTATEVQPETKRTKSLRLAKARMTTALEKIRLIGNLSSPNYELTTTEKEQIVHALHNAAAEIEGQFEDNYNTGKQVWDFGEYK